MDNVITMVLYNRPIYTKVVLDALKLCDNICNYVLLAFIEPGNDEVIELVKTISFAETKIKINPQCFGGGRNTYQAWDRGFESSDFIIHLEDDTVPAPDSLRFMEYCRVRYHEQKQIFSISSYNRYSCPPDQYYAISTRQAYTCWMVGIWRDRWEWAKKDWSPDHKRYATHLTRRAANERLREAYPLLSRVQNIGVENGIHEHSDEWHRVYHHTNHWAGNHTLLPKPYIEVGNPLVTAVMITGTHPDRYKFASMAVDCFKRQEYTHRNLLILNHGKIPLTKMDDASITEMMIEKRQGETIGDLRNLALQHAKGDLILAWDDDDWCGPDRIAIQVAAQRGDVAVLLKRQIRVNLLNGSGFSACMDSGIPNTILYPRLSHLKYESIIFGEGESFIKLFRDIVVIDNDPMLHVCMYDGLNICGAETMMQGFSNHRHINRLDFEETLKSRIKDLLLRYQFYMPSAGSRKNYITLRAKQEHTIGLR